MTRAKHRYLIALGSNQRHHRFGAPPSVLAAALDALDRDGLKLKAASRVHASEPIGPSLRRYANGAALVTTRRDPAELLVKLKAIEASFGRRRGGQRWRARVLDLDIALWSGGAWASPGLMVPHIALRERAFVLGPACELVPRWRDPVTGLSLMQLKVRLTRPRPTPKRRPRSGP